MIKYLGKEVTPLEMKQIRWKKKADFLSDELEKMESLDNFSAQRKIGKLEAYHEILNEIKMEITLEKNPNALSELIEDVKNFTGVLRNGQ